MSDSLWHHRQKPTRLPLPWDSPGKITGVGCHFLLQCIKVKSESEVTQSCPTLSDPMDCSLPSSSVHRIFQARVLERGAITFSNSSQYYPSKLRRLELLEIPWKPAFMFRKKKHLTVKSKRLQGIWFTFHILRSIVSLITKWNIQSFVITSIIHSCILAWRTPQIVWKGKKDMMTGDTRPGLEGVQYATGGEWRAIINSSRNN